MKRKSGVLMHISSLPNNYSCGSFDKNSYKFIDFLSDAGFSYWQILPFCVPDDNGSPYMSQASFLGNPFFIDIEALFSEGLITSEELESEEQSSPFLTDFERLGKTRFSLLKKASQRCTYHKKIADFLKKNPKIEEGCLFLTLKSQNDNKDWTEWTNLQPDPNTLFAWQFSQFVFFEQWQKLKSYANSKGIEIIGDLPFYVSFDSSDVYFQKEQFCLTADNHPECVAGVPPDYFSPEGQLWGNPLYNWDYMKRDGYTWWKQRLETMFRYFDGVRIDHFRAFSEYWSVPASSTSAKDGAWKEGPKKAIIDALNSVSDGKLIIAENLGIIDNNVSKLLDYSGYPGMAVFQFGFDGNPDNPHLIHNYQNNLVAYTGTHDNNTLLGFIWELNENDRRAVLNYIGYMSDNFDQCFDTIKREMLMSSADTVIFPIQDILVHGADTRMNTPGCSEGNWAYRITLEQLQSIDTAYLKNLNATYSR